MPVPVILNFETECQRSNLLQEENEILRQKLFALQAEHSRLKKEEQQQQQEEEELILQHKLPSYVANMDHLGDSELDMTCSQRSNTHSLQARGGFLSSLLSQGKKGPSRAPLATGATSTQTGLTLSGKKEQTTQQSTKGKEAATREAKGHFTSLVTTESSSVQQRQRRLQDHGKERKELLSKITSQGQNTERKIEAITTEQDPSPEVPAEQAETLTKVFGSSTDGGGIRHEQPFIVLSQEEYGEHHSSIMHCRVDCSGRRVASLDVDGVIKVWSFNPMMQTKASSISKSPLLSLEWATKRDRLLLLGSGVGTVRLYDTEAKKNLCEISIDEDMPRILSLACSPSGASFVCSAAASGLINQLDYTGPDSGGKGANQVPGKLLLWDTKTMKQQLQFSLEPEPIAINCTAFNHNGNLLVTGAADGMIRLFDMQQHECAMSWMAHDGEVYSVEFSYDENTVYSIGEDGKLNSNNKVLESCLSLGGHRAPVVTVDWCTAMDCGTCLTASMDGKIKLTTLLAQKS
ncbi:hypothetical protein JD844_028185 [Phrynosoma platyrhinos]|uniref:WD repeat-containing protein 91 n=1 Tax=Phrynosoma platyrhinos TaxID=52577 RepID=A0ABQ7SHK5_PHRPL|nr:hypothetical protein JD844_028185 [Phrynosoma platyrhinos]